MAMDIGTKELRSRLSEILARVERGERVIVHRRGSPVVVLESIAPRDVRLPSLAAFRSRLRVRGQSLSAEVVAARGQERA
jgi:prevent-host-death family protein